MGKTACKPLITQEELHRLFDYDPETGVLTWKMSPRAGFVGRRAGSLCKHGGYRQVRVAGVLRWEHRLVWIYLFGEIPAGLCLDHANGVRDDNRRCNLRLATAQQNCANSRLFRNNTSGIKGVSWDSSKMKWQAQLRIDGKNTTLGRFNTKEAAAAAYQAQAAALRGEFFNAGEYA